MLLWLYLYKEEDFKKKTIRVGVRSAKNKSKIKNERRPRRTSSATFCSGEDASGKTGWRGIRSDVKRRVVRVHARPGRAVVKRASDWRFGEKLESERPRSERRQRWIRDGDEQQREETKKQRWWRDATTTTRDARDGESYRR